MAYFFLLLCELQPAVKGRYRNIITAYQRLRSNQTPPCYMHWKFPWYKQSRILLIELVFDWLKWKPQEQAGEWNLLHYSFLRDSPGTALCIYGLTVYKKILPIPYNSPQGCRRFKRWSGQRDVSYSLSLSLWEIRLFCQTNTSPG